MVRTKVNGVDYEVRVPYDVHFTTANELPVIRRQEPTLRRCDCCDKCPHVERYYEEVHSLDEAVERGWLVKVDGTKATT